MKLTSGGNTDEPTRLNSAKKLRRRKPKKKGFKSKSFEQKVERIRLDDEEEDSSFKNDIDTDDEDSQHHQIKPLNLYLPQARLNFPNKDQLRSFKGANMQPEQITIFNQKPKKSRLVEYGRIFKRAYFRHKLKLNIYHFRKKIIYIQFRRNEYLAKLLHAHLIAYYKGWKLRKIMKTDHVLGQMKTINFIKQQLFTLQQDRSP